MNEPKVILKEMNNHKLVCTVMCILVPVIMVALIYEIRALACRYKGKKENKSCNEEACDLKNSDELVPV